MTIAQISKCAVCHIDSTPEKPLKRCGKCRNVRYCGQECQMKDWPQHKSVCKRTSPAPTTKVVKAIIAEENKVAPIIEVSPEPITTGFLRFINIWDDANQRGLLKEKRSILVLGPGKKEFWTGEVFCPQMAEALKLWGNGSSFTVLDSNPSVLEAVEAIDHDLSRKFFIEAFDLNPSAQKIEEIHKRLTSETPPQYSLHTMRFRMGKDKLPMDFKPVDIIISTLSLYYPIKALAESGQDLDGMKRIRLLGEYLTQLKPGGVMYVDQDNVIALLANPKDLKNPAILKRLLTPANINALKQKIHKLINIDVSFDHLSQIEGLLGIQGLPFVRQPKLCCLDSDAAQTQDAFAIIRKEKSQVL